MKKTFLYLSVVVAAVLNFSCQGEKHAALVELPSTNPTDGPTTVSGVEGVANSSPLYFKIGLGWEPPNGDESTIIYTYSQPCYFEPGSVVGSRKTCRITVPEQKLYYSYIKFRMGTLDTNKCAFVSFQPYYYRRSNIKIYNNWDSEKVDIDCRPPSQVAGCYGGAAPIMLADLWPKYKSFYFLPAVGNQQDFMLRSANKAGQFGGIKINWMATNDISSPAVTGHQTPAIDPMDPEKSTPVGYDEKIDGASGWVDYQISCVDLWGEPQYTLDLLFSDENTVDEVNGGSYDTFPDWY
jgi:hypothetical protein